MPSVTLNQPNAFPLPVGPGNSYSSGQLTGMPGAMGPPWQYIKALWVTPNFTLQMRGLWTVTVNMSDAGNNNDQVILNLVASGTDGSFDGTNTALLTMARSGYYQFAVPQGFARYNFTSVNAIKIAAVTACDLATWNG